MPVVTPGVDFLAFHLVKFSVSTIFLAVFLRALRAIYDCPIPTWALFVGSSFFVPLVHAVRVIHKSLDDKRRAIALGARLAPTVKGKLMGNLDVLLAVEKCMRTGYPGDELGGDILGQEGPIVNIRFMWSDMILTYCPEHIKIILATDFHNYVKGIRNPHVTVVPPNAYIQARALLSGERFKNAADSVLGRGIFSSDGDMWKFHRSTIRPFITRDRVCNFELFDRHANTAIALAKERIHGGYAIDIQDLMLRCTLDAASEFLFGHCVHSLEAGLPYPHNASDVPAESVSTGYNQFSRAFLISQEVVSFRERCGWFWPLMEIFEDKTKGPMKTINAFIDSIIQEALTRRNVASPISKDTKSELRGDDIGTWIDHMIKATSDHAVLRDSILNTVIASRDATATTITFIVYCLAMHPSVNERLREEILTKVGPTRRPDYDDIKKMKYLRAVINESLRLFPIVPFNTRENINATIWPSPDPTQKPIYIPAGTKVPYSVFHMHRRKDIWGPDAEEFDPDRFSDDRFKKYLLKNPFIFLPFNAGPRICPGQQFAYNEVSLTVIRLLQHFSSISLANEASPPEARPPAHWGNGVGRKSVERIHLRSHFGLYAKGGLWVTMEQVANVDEINTYVG